MSRFLDTRGKASLAIAICDRCRFKVPLSDLQSDPNTPALRVCDPCRDQLDPYRLPPRQAEKVAADYPRPDEPMQP